MVIRPDGTLREAGGIVRRDGSAGACLAGASPLAPEVNFVRDVDFVSGDFLMLRRTVAQDLEGFDAAFPPSGPEAADFCLRIAAAGHRVVYDPAVVLFALDTTGQPASRAGTLQSRKALAGKHAAVLAQRPSFAPGCPQAANAKRVLFLEDTVPLRTIGSGFVRSNDIVRTMAGLGYGVTVYPLNGSLFDPAAVYADLPDTVEVMHDRVLADLPDFLAARAGSFDVVWIARTHNLDGVRPILERAFGDAGPRPRMILDTEAIASVRDAEAAALRGEAFDLDAAIAHELRNGAFCETIVAVAGSEAVRLRALGFPDVAVIGHMRALDPTPRPFLQRSGMLFVGAIHRMDSPNYDSLCWFIDEVLPLVERELGWQTRLTVAGYTGDEVSLERFRDHPRVSLRGTVADLRPLYDQHRIFVAPTRVAAGTPYKVYEAASFGLPVVAAELLRRQVVWKDGRELLAAGTSDPVGFARQVVALQRDEALWQRLRDNALERLRRENGAADYAAGIAGVLGPVRSISGD
jgi:glycosyltransferase involved in cell wall biosynthesis